MGKSLDRKMAPIEVIMG